MMQVDAQTVPEILRATRALSGLSSRELAALIGVSHAAVTRWERGEGEPSVTQFLRWAAATKQPAQQLLDGLNVSVCAPRDSNPEPTDYETDDAFWSIVQHVEIGAEA